MKLIVKYISVWLTLWLLASCANDTKFTVEGVVSGADGQTLYLENVGIAEVQTLDSVKLNSAGKFEFKQERPAYPDFYRLKLKNQLINFAVDSTEHIQIWADAGTFATSYKIEGSENAKAMKEITLAQLDANQLIQKYRKEYEHKHMADTAYMNRVNEAAAAYKEVALTYIYGAPMSTVAYYALFQQVNGLLFFDLYDKNDSRAYGAVATSYDHFYPESPRSKQLHHLALQSIKVIRSQRPIDLDKLDAKEVRYMDVELPDVHGTPVKLSEVAQGHPQDMEKARQYLKESGFKLDKNGKLRDKDGNKVEFDLYTNAGNTERESIGVMIKQDLEDLGMSVNFKPVEFNTLVNKLTNTKDWDMVILGFTGSPLEPYGGKNVWYSNGTLHLFNMRGEGETAKLLPWENRLDEIFDAAALELDFEKRRALYEEYQQLIYDEKPLIYLYSPLRIYAVRKKFGNIHPTEIGGVMHNIEEIYIKN